MKSALHASSFVFSIVTYGLRAAAEPWNRAPNVSDDTQVRQASAWILATTILGSSMVFIDSSVVNVALPIIQIELGATIAQAQWVVQAYALFLSALILVGGSLGDHFGRRRVFATGVFVFAAASIFCGVAHSVNQLIAARALQGVASALLTPGSLSLLTVSFNPEQRGRAIGIWSSFTAITASAGPALGGWIVQYASWRWIFFINLPLALAVLAMAWRWVPESRDSEKVHHIDWAGAALATGGLAAIIYGLMAEAGKGWTNYFVAVCLGVGAALLALFVVREKQARSPMLPLGLFSSRNFTVVNILTLLLYAALGGALFFLPFNLILIQHYSPLAAGLALLPFIVLMFLISPWAGGLVKSVGPKAPLVIGPLISACALGSLALTNIGGSYWLTFFPSVAALGLGMAITVAPLTTTVMSSVDADHVGIASAVNNAVSRTGGLLAVAILNLIVIAIFNHALTQRLAAMPALPAQAAAAVEAQRPKLAAAQPPQSLPPVWRNQLRSAIAYSYVSGFRYAMLAAAFLALFAAVTAALGITPLRPAPAGLPRKTE